MLAQLVEFDAASPDDHCVALPALNDLVCDNRCRDIF